VAFGPGLNRWTLAINHSTVNSIRPSGCSGPPRAETILPTSDRHFLLRWNCQAPLFLLSRVGSSESFGISIELRFWAGICSCAGDARLIKYEVQSRFRLPKINWTCSTLKRHTRLMIIRLRPKLTAGHQCVIEMFWLPCCFWWGCATLSYTAFHSWSWALCWRRWGEHDLGIRTSILSKCLYVTVCSWGLLTCDDLSRGGMRINGVKSVLCKRLHILVGEQSP